MKKGILILMQVLLLPFPWSIRKYLLNFLSGFSIHKRAKIGISIILADRVIMEEGALITHFNFVNKLDCLHMKTHSKIGRSNWVTGANSKAKMFSDSNRKCELILGKHTRITAKHHIDCTGGVYIGDFTTVAGIQSQILSHSVDIKLSKQVAGPVYIGKYCFIGTSSIILMGAQLPDYCVLGAGAVLNKKYEKSYQLYAGNPARMLKNLPQKKYKYFKREHGHVA
ncbi:MAG TPA: acyltransferase [Bacteroidales bacterium]|nr:acyltransferase [Bacteroidales bacterium]